MRLSAVLFIYSFAEHCLTYALAFSLIEYGLVSTSFASWSLIYHITTYTLQSVKATRSWRWSRFVLRLSPVIKMETDIELQVTLTLLDFGTYLISLSLYYNKLANLFFINVNSCRNGLVRSIFRLVNLLMSSSKAAGAKMFVRECLLPQILLSRDILQPQCHKLRAN